MRMKQAALAIITALALLPLGLVASDSPGGATIIPIQDSIIRQPFDIKTDFASIYLEKAILFKENGWFTKEKEVIITAKITIISIKRDYTSTTLTSSKIYKFDVTTFDDGRTEIPLKSIPLLNPYSLSGNDYIITNIIMELFISKKREKSDFTKTLETIIDVSKKIPTPTDPSNEIVKGIGEAFSQIVDKAITEGAETVPFAVFGLRFPQGKGAEAYTERPGVHAIITQGNPREPNVIVLERIDASKVRYNDIEGLRLDNQKIKNNHLIIRVVASLDPWKSLMATKSTLEKILSEGESAVKISRAKSIQIPNIKSILQQYGTSQAPIDMISTNPALVGAAVKELNEIRNANTTDHKQ